MHPPACLMRSHALELIDVKRSCRISTNEASGSMTCLRRRCPHPPGRHALHRSSHCTSEQVTSLCAACAAASSRRYRQAGKSQHVHTTCVPAASAHVSLSAFEIPARPHHLQGPSLTNAHIVPDVVDHVNLEDAVAMRIQYGERIVTTGNELRPSEVPCSHALQCTG